MAGKPILTGSTACCARAASGQPAAATPSSVMNSRRLMGCPKSDDHTLPHRRRNAALCITAKLIVEWQRWVDAVEKVSAKTRMNVVHEAGLFQVRLGFSKAVVLLEEGCEQFSNIQGVGQIRFSKGNISAAFEEVRRVLEREGLIAGPEMTHS
jgi:hypothetical protein